MAVALVHVPSVIQQVALDDVSATEWRRARAATMPARWAVALDDVSATEWREDSGAYRTTELRLHSMMSVLPNGGISTSRSCNPPRLHSMMSVLPNGGRRRQRECQTCPRLHSMMSVLPNGGCEACCLQPVIPLLHSMMSVLPNGGFSCLAGVLPITGCTR